VTFETALNVLWCAIGVVALLGLYLSERRKGPRDTTGRMRRILAVVLTTVSLFPCVSATDDEFCFSLLQSTSGKHDGMGAPLPEDAREKASLGRILETIDHYQLSSAYSFAVIFWFIGLVLLATKPVTMRARLQRAGRSPPLVSFA
jgi:hypothetical protein